MEQAQFSRLIVAKRSASQRQSLCLTMLKRVDIVAVGRTRIIAPAWNMG